MLATQSGGLGGPSRMSFWLAETNAETLWASGAPRIAPGTTMTAARNRVAISAANVRRPPSISSRLRNKGQVVKKRTTPHTAADRKGRSTSRHKSASTTTAMPPIHSSILLRPIRPVGTSAMRMLAQFFQRLLHLRVLRLELLEALCIVQRFVVIAGLLQEAHQRGERIAIIRMRLDGTFQRLDCCTVFAGAVQRDRVDVNIARVAGIVPRSRRQQVERLRTALLTHHQQPERVFERRVLESAFALVVPVLRAINVGQVDRGRRKTRVERQRRLEFILGLVETILPR